MAEPAELRFLDALSREQLDALRALGRIRRYPVGARLFHERDPGDAVLLLQAGRVKLSSVTEGGREALLGIREPGELIGEMSAIDAAPRSATATALEPVEVLALSSQAFTAYLERTPGVAILLVRMLNRRLRSSQAFTAYLERTPGVAILLVRMLNRRLRDADRKRTEFLAQDTVGRVCSRLVELADRFGETNDDGTHIDLAITQEDLAGWTGSSREAVIRALRTLRELDWIATRRRGVTLLEVEMLRRRAV